MKFGEDKSSATLVLEILRIKMDSKEKVKDLNQRFLTFLNKILVASWPTDVALIEFYNSAFPVTPTLFIKRVGETTLKEKFKEAIKVEKETMILIGNLGSKEKKSPPLPKKENN